VQCGKPAALTHLCKPAARHNPRSDLDFCGVLYFGCNRNLGILVILESFYEKELGGWVGGLAKTT
jgi:hypothetical protein